MNASLIYDISNIFFKLATDKELSFAEQDILQPIGKTKRIGFES